MPTSPRPPGGGRPAAGPDVRVVVPVKGFERSKARLSGALSDPDRAELARSLATQVVASAAPFRVLVACDDDAVAQWALELGAEVARTDGLDLNGSVQSAVDGLGPEVRVAVVVHADLADPARLAATVHDAEVLVRQGYAVLVPDLDDDGTNVLAVPTGSGFEFAYGAGSAARHRDEARRRGLKVHAVVDSPLAWDVDHPDDLP
ncbi:MAG: 2-phospho-L-lactate guanylyltransferase [Actinomycetes bacterium]